MSAAPIAAPEPLDASSLQAIMIRWKLAEQYLLSLPATDDPGKMALEVLIERDLPTLLRELMSLRPELAFQGPDPATGTPVIK